LLISVNVIDLVYGVFTCHDLPNHTMGKILFTIDAKDKVSVTAQAPCNPATAKQNSIGCVIRKQITQSIN
jgi:hypothetical protein